MLCLLAANYLAVFGFVLWMPLFSGSEPSSAVPFPAWADHSKWSPGLCAPLHCMGAGSCLRHSLVKSSAHAVLIMLGVYFHSLHHFPLFQVIEAQKERREKEETEQETAVRKFCWVTGSWGGTGGAVAQAAPQTWGDLVGWAPATLPISGVLLVRKG